MNLDKVYGVQYRQFIGCDASLEASGNTVDTFISLLARIGLKQRKVRFFVGNNDDCVKGRVSEYVDVQLGDKGIDYYKVFSDNFVCYVSLCGFKHMRFVIKLPDERDYKALLQKGVFDSVDMVLTKAEKIGGLGDIYLYEKLSQLGYLDGEKVRSITFDVNLLLVFIESLNELKNCKEIRDSSGREFTKKCESILILKFGRDYVNKVLREARIRPWVWLGLKAWF